jgi:site-specific DNA-adenine methylase
MPLAVILGGIMQEVKRPLVRYHGSKWSIAPWIISYIPKHRVYVEPYGGGASVLLRKSRAHEEVYNDLDGDIVNLFRAARDNGEELRRLIELTPFSREEYLKAYKPTDDPVEQARRTVIRAFMGRASTGATGKISDSGSIATGVKAKTTGCGKTSAKVWDSYPGALQAIIRRLKGVVIENKDALEVIDQHDSTQTLFYIDPPYLFSTALPSITRGGTITIGSTPLGKIGIFYDIYTDKKNYPDYVRYTVPWWHSRALCNSIDEAKAMAVKNIETEERVRRFGTKVLKQEFTALGIQSFQQEYECVFIDSAESYISLDLIYANTPGMREGDRPVPLRNDEEESGDIEIYSFKTADDLLVGYEPEIHGPHLFLGYDVARRRDAAVIFVIGQLPNGKKRSVANIEMVNQTFDYQRDQIRKIMKSLPILRGCIDKTGQGEDTTETLQREFTSTRLEGVEFNIQSKEELVRGIREGLEKGEFLLQNDSRFHRQIHSIKRMPTSGGAFRYDSERDDLGHADSFWAWALANYAIPKQTAAKGFYEQYREIREKKRVTAAGQGTGESAESGSRRGKPLNKVLRKWGMN